MLKEDVWIIGLCAFLLGLLCFSYNVAYAQIVPAQNQQLLAPYGGWVVATSSSATSKLSASTTPFFSSFFATLGNIGTLTLPSQTSALLITNGSGVVAEYGGSACGGGQFGTALSALGVLTCGTPAASTGNVATSSAETATYVPFWTSTSGTPALLSGGESTFAYNATDNRLTVTSASTTAFSSLYASSTSGFFGNLTLPSLTSALLQTDGNGVTSEYAGTTCTNQFVRSLSVLGIAVCEQVDLTLDVVGTLSFGNGGLGFNSGANGDLLYIDGGGPSVAKLGIGTPNDVLTVGAGPVLQWTNSLDLTNLEVNGDLALPSLADGCLELVGDIVSSTGVSCLTAALTSIGPAGQLQTGPAITLASSTSSFNGLTVRTTIVGGTNTITWTPSLTGTLNNAGLTNSTISGIALGANLADLTATNGTLTFSGAYNGGTARTVGLNLSNANTWLAAQTIASTLLNVTGLADGCIQIASNQLTSTGSACGSGGGGANSKWATTTVPSGGLTPNGGVNAAVGVGTTTPLGAQLVVASSSGSGIKLTDGSVTSPQWNIRSAGGYLYFATTTAALPFATTTTSTALTITPTGTVSIGTSTPQTTATLALWEQSEVGPSPSVFMGGNPGGDTDFWFARVTDNDGVDDDFFRIGKSTTIGSDVVMTLDTMGDVGIASSTPWALLAVASSTWGTIPADYNRPLFAVATSTLDYGQLMGIFATTTNQATTNPTLFQNIISGARVIIGAISQYGFGGVLDQLFVNGRINTGDWYFNECNTLSINTSVTADTSSVCGSWHYQIDTNGTLGDSSTINTATHGAPLIRIQLAAASVNAGSGLFLGPSGAYSLSTTTPVMEVSTTLVAPAIAVGTSTRYIGFTTTQPGSSTFENTPTAGCYVTASTTQANWQAVCGAASTYTVVDSGVSSTTATLTRFRIEMDATQARFYKQSAGVPMTLLTTISSNYPATTNLYPSAYIATGATGRTSAEFLILDSLRLWFRKGLY